MRQIYGKVKRILCENCRIAYLKPMPGCELQCKNCGMVIDCTDP